MPLFYTHIVNATTRLAIWHIHEDADFFLEAVPVSRAISHPHKRLQHLAGRFLLQHLFPGFPLQLIQVADTKKPFLAGKSHHFSISHCGDYAAAIVSTTHRVGIDIEIPDEKIQRIRDKFLDVSEQNIIAGTEFSLPGELIPLNKNYIYPLTIAWSSKEAMFKWYGAGQVDFRKHMRLNGFSITNQSGVVDALFIKEEPIKTKLYFEVFAGLVLSWMATAVHYRLPSLLPLPAAPPGI